MDDVNNFSHLKADLDGNWEEQAQWFIEYYEHHASLKEGIDTPVGIYGDIWLLGLFMAKYWLRLLVQPNHDISELRFFVDVLNAERKNQGSGWHDMRNRVQNWVSEIEES